MTLAETELSQGALAQKRAPDATERGQWLAVAGLFVLAVVVMALPVAWNGFVFIYHDSVDYLGLTFTWQLPEFRTACYGLFAGLGRLAGDPVAIVLAQSALVVGTIALSVRAQFAPPRFLAAFALALLGALLGGLPLYASQIMADLFAGAAVLGLVSLMVFFDGLSPARRILLAALCAIAIAVHTSHFALALGLLALGLLVRLGRMRWPGLPALRLREALLASLLGVALAMGSNAYVTGRLFLTQTVTVQNLALFIEGGTAKAYLDAHCPAPGAAPQKVPFRLCGYKDKLPATANAFLWAFGISPLYKLGGWDEMHKEADAIVKGALSTMPGAVARQSVRLTAEQLVMLDPGDGLDARTPFYLHAIGAWYPHSLKAFATSRQQHGIDFSPLYWPTRVVMGLSLATILILAAASRRRPRQAVFGAAILLAVVGNAFVCGALSNPNHRYEGRLVWLVASAAMLMVTARALPAQAEKRPMAG